MNMERRTFTNTQQVQAFLLNYILHKLEPSFQLFYDAQFPLDDRNNMPFLMSPLLCNIAIEN